MGKFAAALTRRGRCRQGGHYERHQTGTYCVFDRRRGRVRRGVGAAARRRTSARKNLRHENLSADRSRRAGYIRRHVRRRRSKRTPADASRPKSIRRANWAPSRDRSKARNSAPSSASVIPPEFFVGVDERFEVHGRSRTRQFDGARPAAARPIRHVMKLMLGAWRQQRACAASRCSWTRTVRRSSQRPRSAVSPTSRARRFGSSLRSSRARRWNRLGATPVAMTLGDVLAGIAARRDRRRRRRRRTICSNLHFMDASKYVTDDRSAGDLPRSLRSTRSGTIRCRRICRRSSTRTPPSNRLEFGPLPRICTTNQKPLGLPQEANRSICRLQGRLQS